MKRKMSKNGKKIKLPVSQPPPDVSPRPGVEPICGNCLLYNRDKSECKVAVFINNFRFHMPVEASDRCHMDELGIKVEQVRWWTEDKFGRPTDKDGKVKIQYPVGFFDALDPTDFINVGQKEVPPLPVKEKKGE